MDVSLNYLGIAFLQGLALYQTAVIILPVFLILLFGSLTGNYQRPLGMLCGFVFTFAGFTVLSRLIVENSGLDLDIYRMSAFLLIALYGVLMSCDYLHRKFNHFTQIFVGVSEDKLTEEHNNFVMGLLLGIFLAVAWTPYNSSVLDAVIVQTIIHKITFTSFLVLTAFTLGAALPVLLLTALLRLIIAKLAWLKKHIHIIHNISGFIILVTILFVAHDYPFSAPIFSINKTGEANYQSKIINGVAQPYPVPNIDGIETWINTGPLTRADINGKVVLIYFWTYSCIHCTHAAPHIIDWYNNYRDNGFLIIGVHTPEFEFEKNIKNVESTVANFKIPYPVAIDNKFVTWQNFHNKNWPAYYLINKNGDVVYEQVGEGNYNEIENNIRYLLGFNTVADDTSSGENINENSPLLAAGTTPETHLGSDHDKIYSGLPPLDKTTARVYSFPPTLTEATWALAGKWTVAANNIIAESENAAVKIRFHSQQVFAIIGMKDNKKVAVKVLLDGKPVSIGAGNAVTNSILDIDSPRLYEILNLDKPRSGELELIVPKGVELYTFSFDDL
jgi:cytochrome c biogenesis protein CcdA/thiol-disulfide isomerase/thioredoxin